MSKIEKLVDELSALTVLEAADLSKLLEEKWGVSAAAPVAVAAAAGPAAAAEVVEEQTEFTVILTGGGDKKINVIKEVRSIRPDLGLKEAKDLVEGAPQNVKENISKQEAADVKAKLEPAGASVTVKYPAGGRRPPATRDSGARAATSGPLPCRPGSGTTSEWMSCNP